MRWRRAAGDLKRKRVEKILQSVDFGEQSFRIGSVDHYSEEEYGKEVILSFNEETDIFMKPLREAHSLEELVATITGAYTIRRAGGELEEIATQGEISHHEARLSSRSSSVPISYSMLNPFSQKFIYIRSG